MMERQPVTTPKKTWADSGFRKLGFSWLYLSQTDKEKLRKAPRFLAASRYGKV